MVCVGFLWSLWICINLEAMLSGYDLLQGCQAFRGEIIAYKICQAEEFLG